MCIRDSLRIGGADRGERVRAQKTAYDQGVRHIIEPVSYTHLDVYKRQAGGRGRIVSGDGVLSA